MIENVVVLIGAFVGLVVLVTVIVVVFAIVDAFKPRKNKYINRKWDW